MNDQDINDQLAETLQRMQAFRDGDGFTRDTAREMVAAAGRMIYALLEDHADNMAQAIQVAEQQRERIRSLMETNRNICEQVVLEQCQAGNA